MNCSGSFPGSAGVSPASRRADILARSNVATSRRSEESPHLASRRFAASLLACGLLVGAAWADAPPSPFALNATMTLSNEVAWVTFDFLVPPQHVLYAERLAFFADDGKPLKPASIP